MKEVVERIENWVRKKRQQSTVEEMAAELMSWIPDPGVSRSREIKYLKMIALYWINKAFIADVVEETGMQQQAILQKLNKMGRKYGVCKAGQSNMGFGSNQ